MTWSVSVVITGGEASGGDGGGGPEAGSRTGPAGRAAEAGPGRHGPGRPPAQRGEAPPPSTAPRRPWQGERLGEEGFENGEKRRPNRLHWSKPDEL